MTWVIRMNPDCVLICPKVELPADTDEKLLVWTRLNRLITSNLSCADLAPPMLKFFDTDTSVLINRGVRTSVVRRGAVPQVPAAASDTAAGLTQVTVGWSAEARRDARSPDVARSTPGTRFGRCALPSSPRLSLCARPIGNPLCTLITAAAVQPAASRFVMPLLLAGDGNCHTGEMITRCGTSRTPIWYSASGLKQAALLVVVHAGIPAM